MLKKNISFLIILSIVLCKFSLIAQPVVNGQFILTGNGDDYGSVTELLDGNFLYTGATTTYGSGGRDILIIKFAQDFSIVWQKTIGNLNDEFVYDRHHVHENADGTIVIVGNSTEGIIGGEDILLLKLDGLGNSLWSKVYGGTSNERGITLEKSLDGGYILGGNTYSYPNGNNNIYLVKIDSNGVIGWNWSFGNTLKTATQITDIVTLTDSSYIFSGVYDGASSNGNSFIGRIDKNGTLLWIKRYTFGNNFGWEGVNGLSLANNSIIATGVTRGFMQHGGLSDGIVLNLDFNGNVIWSKVYGGVGDDWLYRVNIDNQQNIISVIYSNSIGFGSFDMGLLKLNSLGNVIAYNVFGSSGVEHAKFFSNTIDGGVVVSGSTTGFGAIQKDGIITKLDSNLFFDCNISSEIISEVNVVLTPQVLSAPIDLGGGQATILLQNNTVSIVLDTICIDTSDVSCIIKSDFVSTSFCSGDFTSFTDLSIDNNSNIINWQWYFGDGDSIVGVQNPSHLYTSSGTFNVTLAVTNDSNCVDSITIPIDINPSYQINVTDSICQGDSILLGGSFQYSAGIYADSLQSILGCDSIVTTILTINPIFSSIQSQITCQGDSVLFGGTFYNNTGVYTDSLQTILGCDSLEILDLTVNPSYQSVINQTICQGDSVLFGGTFYHNTGIFIDSLQTILGCDSIEILDLTINPPYQINVRDSICQGDSILLGGSFQHTAGIYTDSLQSIFGCDSIVTTILTINPIFSSIQNQTICQGDSIFLGGGFQHTAGIYADSLQSVLGCDSIIATTLTINPIFSSIQNQTICQGDSILFGGTFYNNTGIYTDSLQTILGCDSIEILDLTVNLPYQINVTDSTCQGDSILLGGSFQYSAGIYTDSLQSVLGCDSIINTTLAVENNYYGSVSVNICQGDSIFLEGEFQYEAGVYTDSLQSINGCDSIVNTALQIDIVPQVIASIDTLIDKGSEVQLSAFGGDSYVWIPNYNLSCNDCQNPLSFPEITTAYIVEGKIGDCVSYDTVIVSVNNYDALLFFPNSFTPNNDGLNDFFNVYGENIKEFKISIFNRWGELLFESNNIMNGWNGTYKGVTVPVGVYVYKVEAVSKNFRRYKKAGHINLVK